MLRLKNCIEVYAPPFERRTCWLCWSGVGFDSIGFYWGVSRPCKALKTPVRDPRPATTATTVRPSPMPDF